MDLWFVVYMIGFVALFYFLLELKEKILRWGASQLPDQPLPYQLSGPLFTPAERSFFGVLVLAVGDEARVFGKVRIADIIKPYSNLSRQEWHIAFNKISRKHFDFVLCRPDDLSVICAIELDDKSHESSQQKKRDKLVESACKSAGLSLHRFKARNRYSPKEVSKILFGESSSTDEAEVQNDENQCHGHVKPPINDLVCPQCFSDLDRKISAFGANKGKEMLVCSSFPKCKFVKVS